jgi:hypothetical protein
MIKTILGILALSAIFTGFTENSFAREITPEERASACQSVAEIGPNVTDCLNLIFDIKSEENCVLKIGLRGFDRNAAYFRCETYLPASPFCHVPTMPAAACQRRPIRDLNDDASEN